MMFEHEQVQLRTGRRSGATIIVAIHSTQPGTALGGCRIATYPDVTAGLEDALRLSKAMTLKAFHAGLPMGGGKTVVALAPGAGHDRRAILHDTGDIIDTFGGTYLTGPDVGTGPEDMAVMGERTRYVMCRPRALGGSGDSSSHTALGVLAAIKAVCPDARRFTIVGLGNVGGHLARLLAADGHTLALADIDPSRRALAAFLGASWTAPEAALGTRCDVLIPAATGGVITAELVPRLRCGAIIGPANNQLATAEVAALLEERGIVWVPDFIASAGGIINAVATEIYRETPERIAERIAAIGQKALAYIKKPCGTKLNPT